MLEKIKLSPHKLSFQQSTNALIMSLEDRLQSPNVLRSWPCWSSEQVYKTFCLLVSKQFCGQYLKSSEARWGARAGKWGSSSGCNCDVGRWWSSQWLTTCIHKDTLLHPSIWLTQRHSSTPKYFSDTKPFFYTQVFLWHKAFLPSLSLTQSHCSWLKSFDTKPLFLTEVFLWHKATVPNWSLLTQSHCS